MEVMEILAGGLGAIIGGLITALSQNLVSNKNINEKLVVHKEEVRKDCDSIVKDSVINHEKIKHQDSMSNYVEEEITKHKHNCGLLYQTADLKEVINKLGAAINRLERNQNVMESNLKVMTLVVSSLARKMDLPIDLTDINKG